MKQKGFTMIELLIVITIIGVLAAMGGANYLKSLSKGRDAKRIQDVQEIQKGFETYYAKYSTYTAATQSMFADKAIFPTGQPVETMPGHAAYSYLNQSTSSYCVCASIENTTTFSNSDATCSFAGVKDHYCAVNSQ